MTSPVGSLLVRSSDGPASGPVPGPGRGPGRGASGDDLSCLLARSARGDEAAFALLYRALAVPVHGVALRTLRNTAHAEEVTQEVLLEVWRTAAAYRPDRGSVLAWALTIAHHRAVDRVRSVRAATERDHHAAVGEPEEQAPTDAEAVRLLDGLRLRTALASLSRLQREALVLAYYGGYSQREIADLLNVPLGTVKTRTRDALSRLRTAFEVPGNHGGNGGRWDGPAPAPGEESGRDSPRASARAEGTTDSRPAPRPVRPPARPAAPAAPSPPTMPRPRPAPVPAPAPAAHGHHDAPAAGERRQPPAQSPPPDTRTPPPPPRREHASAGPAAAPLDSATGDRHHGGVPCGNGRGKEHRMPTPTPGPDGGRQDGDPPPTADPLDDAGLPTGGVAQRLGVSPTTIRSWERRYGIGPAHREAGHHRRWSRQDIAVLERMCRLTSRGVAPGEAARSALAGRDAPPPSGADGTHSAPAPAAAPATPGPGPGGSRALRLGAVRPECRGLTRAAVRLDAPEVAGILRDAVRTFGVVDAWTEVMMPALRAAGRKWAADGEHYVEVEHLLSWHVSSVLRATALDAVTARPVPPVLLAATPGEQHTLPLEATAAALAERGLAFRMLGAAVPPRALLDAVHRIGPGAVMIWSQDRRTADDELVRQVGAARWGPRGSRARAAVVAAGPGWARARLPAGAARPRALVDAVDLLEEAVTG
ncbi:sigma-70 family RNA polymerase sigma factor [Kitasatospora sp. NPDC056327]|uniref:sigma-70 family RNA polymerase sigma factor n=1 Tax=Kitasatospora sp. NPDC056327 TaxID=3345785 RepID=UPI0035DBA892